MVNHVNTELLYQNHRGNPSFWIKFSFQLKKLVKKQFPTKLIDFVVFHYIKNIIPRPFLSKIFFKVYRITPGKPRTKVRGWGVCIILVGKLE